MLLVVVEAKGAVDRPVVGYDDTAPLAVVVALGGGLGVIYSGKSPSLLQTLYRALTREGELLVAVRTDGLLQTLYGVLAREG